MSNKSLYAVPAALNADAYKSGHPKQYPAGTSKIYLNMTPRGDKYFNTPFKKDGVVAFGIKRFCQDYLKDHWNESFFNRPKEEAVWETLNIMNGVLGEGAIDAAHWEALHDLGYLPVEVYAVPEGTLVPNKVPMIIYTNTVEGFHWVAGFLEDAFSAELWKACTIATIAMHYKRIGLKWAKETCDNDLHLPWQFHDFAMRGMSGLTDDGFNAVGHLTSFMGTDSFPAVYTAKRMYAQDMAVSQIGGSVPATEHSVMCANIAVEAYDILKEHELSKEDLLMSAELSTFENLLNTYPTGILSVVSDTNNYWRTLSEILPALRENIMNRGGKLVIRPDSGNPVHIVAGYKAVELTEAVDIINEHADPFFGKMLFDEMSLGMLPVYGKNILKDLGYELVVDQEDLDGCKTINLYGNTHEVKWMSTEEVHGSIWTLYSIFGGTINSKGYKVLDSHVGLIYGDSITMERANEILERLANKGFASSNVVFGVGSYTYQYLTRDTFAFAVKATLAKVNGQEFFLSKNPATDDGTKKSAQGGVVAVYGSKLEMVDNLSFQELEERLQNSKDYTSAMELVFKNSEVYSEANLEDIRKLINEQL